jgi:uncharacterized membrane protein
MTNYPATIYLLKYFFLWLHLFSAILFIGGSFFMWLVLVPATKEAIGNEVERTALVARISKRFARLTWMLLVTLIITGAINATWYVAPGTAGGSARLYLTYAMIALTIALITMLYGPGRHYGRQIAKLAKEKDINGLKKVRRKSNIVSYTNLTIMVAITVIAVIM